MGCDRSVSDSLVSVFVSEDSGIRARSLGLASNLLHLRFKVFRLDYRRSCRISSTGVLTRSIIFSDGSLIC